MQANNKESTLHTASLLTMLLSAGLLVLVGERTAAGLLQWISVLRGGLRGDLVSGPGPAVILGSMGLVVVALALRWGAAGRGAKSAIVISTWAAILAFTSLVIYLSMSLGPITIWRA
jgi:hypothetical protein